MPSYLLHNKKTGEQFVEFLSISQLDQYLKDNPDCEQLVYGAPAIGDSIRMGLKKPDDGFRDRLREIKKAHSKGITRSTINVF